MAEKETKMVVGLGNPGSKYQSSRHNAGFMAVALFAEKLGLTNARVSGPNLVAFGKTEGVKAILVWPQSFMNNSGPAVRGIFDFYKISPANLLVVHDELDLPLGRLKFSQGKGTAGHRGVESILTVITPNFDRLRFGIGRPVKTAFQEKPTDYVLSPFTSLETEIVDQALKRAADLIGVWLAKDLAAAQRLGNRIEKPPKPKKVAESSESSPEDIVITKN